LRRYFGLANDEGKECDAEKKDKENDREAG
jgi:hypothetical protein